MISPLPPDTPIKRWTRAEFDRAREILRQRRLELVEADVVDKKPESWAHSRSKDQIYDWLKPVFGADRVARAVFIDVAPEDNPKNEPQPDVIALNRAVREIAGNPGPQDIQLLVEVSDLLSLGYDFHIKGPLYARAGIPEYWLAELMRRRIIVHREPQEGKYKSIIAYNEEETISPLAAPAASLKVADAFAL
jgi:Uma2 family endonuclease